MNDQQSNKPKFVTAEELLEIKRNRTYKERYDLLMYLRRLHKQMEEAKKNMKPGSDGHLA